MWEKMEGLAGRVDFAEAPGGTVTLRFHAPPVQYLRVTTTAFFQAPKLRKAPGRARSTGL